MADPQAGRAPSAGGAPSGAGGAPFGSDDEDDEDEPMPRVLALPESASVSARKVAKKAWPPVEPGSQFIIYCPANLADYLQAECTALMKVNEDGSLVCCEVGCLTPHFGLSSKTRAPYNAALHLRSRHLVQMLRSRATAAAAALVPARKVAKVGAPVRSTEAAAARLGVTILEPDEAIAARSREHEAAQATRLNTEAAHAARRAALSAAASATIGAGGTPGASGAGSASGALVFASRGPRRFESALSGSLASQRGVQS